MKRKNAPRVHFSLLVLCYLEVRPLRADGPAPGPADRAVFFERRTKGVEQAFRFSLPSFARAKAQRPCPLWRAARRAGGFRGPIYGQGA
jgi:hypothetical protein